MASKYSKSIKQPVEYSRLQMIKRGKVASEIISTRSLNKVLRKFSQDSKKLLLDKPEQFALYTSLNIVMSVSADENKGSYT